MQNKGFKFTGKSSCFVKVDNFFLAVFFFNFTHQVAGYSVQSRRVPVPGTRLLIKTLGMFKAWNGRKMALNGESQCVIRLLVRVNSY